MWTFVLTDLAGSELSELPGAKSKATSRAVGSMGTSSVTVPGWSEDADLLLGGDALLQVWDISDTDPTDRQLFAHHRLVTAEEVGDANGTTVAAAFADPFWLLTKRLIGKSATGYSRGSSVSLVDRGTIISELITATNAESATGLRVGTLTASTSTYVAGWYYKRISEAVAELAAVLDGPDWRVRPIAYDGGVIGELDIAPSLSTVQRDAVFEYGEGRANVASFRRAVSLEGIANRVFSLPSGFPDNATASVLQRDDAASQAARGLFEDVVATDLSVQEFRDNLLRTHIGARANPRQTITFQPVRDLTGKRVPRLGRDYEVGDVVPFRATIRRRRADLVKRINVLTRIYKAEVSVDDSGAGTVSLTVTPSSS